MFGISHGKHNRPDIVHEFGVNSLFHAHIRKKSKEHLDRNTGFIYTGKMIFLKVKEAYFLE